jgi:hypothetical protein
VARLNPHRLDELDDILGTRIAALRRKYDEHESHQAEIEKYLTLAERAVMRHTLARLTAEIEWHEEVQQQRSEIIADERLKDTSHG